VSPSSTEPREVVKLDLSAGSVHTILIDGRPHVVLKPAIEELGLAYSPQLRKLKSRSWGVVTETVTTGADGKSYEMAATTVRSFLMLMAGVNEHRVAELVRPVLVAFQNETADAIEAYWTRGEMPVRETETHDLAPTTVSWEQASAIARLRHGLDVTTPELRELLMKGGILTLTGRPHKRWEHMFWPLATRWEIHESVIPQLIAFAGQIRRELARAEQELQMSLPMPLTVLADNVRQIGGVR
jgi:hypothetical protein